MNDASRTRRDAKARNLCARICDDRASEDEIDVADEWWSRIETGRERYGQLVLKGDPRDWQKELRDELLDLLAYGRIIDVIRKRERPMRVAELSTTDAKELFAFDMEAE